MMASRREIRLGRLCGRRRAGRHRLTLDPCERPGATPATTQRPGVWERPSRRRLGQFETVSAHHRSLRKMMAAADAINPAVPTVLDIVEAPDPTSEHADTAGLSAVVTSQDVESDPKRPRRSLIVPEAAKNRTISTVDPDARHTPKPRPTAPRRPQGPHRHRTRHGTHHRRRTHHRHRTRRSVDGLRVGRSNVAEEAVAAMMGGSERAQAMAHQLTSSDMLLVWW